MIRNRSCTNPSPRCGGNYCHGSTVAYKMTFCYDQKNCHGGYNSLSLLVLLEHINDIRKENWPTKLFALINQVNLWNQHFLPRHKRRSAQHKLLEMMVMWCKNKRNFSILCVLSFVRRKVNFRKFRMIKYGKTLSNEKKMCTTLTDCSNYWKL